MNPLDVDIKAKPKHPLYDSYSNYSPLSERKSPKHHISKKSRSTSTPHTHRASLAMNHLHAMADDAVSKRRSELRSLQQSRLNDTSVEDLIARSRRVTGSIMNIGVTPLIRSKTPKRATFTSLQLRKHATQSLVESKNSKIIGNISQNTNQSGQKLAPLKIDERNSNSRYSTTDNDSRLTITQNLTDTKRASFAPRDEVITEDEFSIKRQLLLDYPTKMPTRLTSSINSVNANDKDLNVSSPLVCTLFPNSESNDTTKTHTMKLPPNPSDEEGRYFHKCTPNTQLCEDKRGYSTLDAGHTPAVQRSVYLSIHDTEYNSMSENVQYNPTNMMVVCQDQDHSSNVKKKEQYLKKISVQKHFNHDNCSIHSSFPITSNSNEEEHSSVISQLTTSVTNDSRVFSINARNNNIQMSAQLILMKDFNRVTEEKAQALNRITELEKKVENLQWKDDNSYNDEYIEKLLEKMKEIYKHNENIYDVLTHVRECLKMRINDIEDTNTKVKSRMDNKEIMGLTLTRCNRKTMISSSYKRNKSPRFQFPLPVDSLMDGKDIGENAFSIAFQSISVQYMSDLARYTIRTPFRDNNIDRLTFNQNWIHSYESYINSASIQKSESLEIMAYIEADESILILHETNCCRHGTKMSADEVMSLTSSGSVNNSPNIPVEFEWKMYIISGDEERRILYIDKEGNDGEYTLNDVYEEAWLVREAYCTSVLNAARSLQKGLQQQIQGSSTTLSKKSVVKKNYGTNTEMNLNVTVDACVGTDQPSGLVISQTPTFGCSKQNILQSPFLAEGTNIYFLIVSFIYPFTWLLFTIFEIIWIMFIRLPIQLMKTFLMGGLFIYFILMLWLYLSEDNGAYCYGAGVNYQFNPAGIW